MTDLFNRFDAEFGYLIALFFMANELIDFITALSSGGSRAPPRMVTHTPNSSVIDPSSARIHTILSYSFILRQVIAELRQRLYVDYKCPQMPL